MNDKMRPAMIGGVILGALSVIPFVNLLNACCCAWAILGGLLAANFYIKGAATPATPADGAQVGAIAGIVGAAINFVVGIPLNYFLNQAMMGGMISLFSRIMPPEAAEQFRRQVEEQQAAQSGFLEYLPQALLFGLIGAALLVLFAAVGGILGVTIFEKRKGGPPPPPPPPNFGAPPGGYGQGAGYGQGGQFGAGS